MKRAVIVHCWGGNSDYAWYPWAKSQLEGTGYSVTVPDMPDTDTPQFAKWLSTLQKTVGTADEELILIGHSLGAVIIMRYLEALGRGEKIRKAIFVAGFNDSLGFAEIQSFFKTPFDYPLIKSKSIEGFTMIQSDNDPYVPMSVARGLAAQLGAVFVVKHLAFHMSGGVDDEPECKQLPEVIAAI